MSDDTVEPVGPRLDPVIVDEGIALLGGGAKGIAFLREFADTFETELPDMLAELRVRIAQGDYAGASDLAHRIKQRAKTLGLVYLQEVGHRLERDPLSDWAATVVAGLKGHADAALDDLRAHFAERIAAWDRDAT